jgi:hypothetical protein
MQVASETGFGSAQGFGNADAAERAYGTAIEHAFRLIACNNDFAAKKLAACTGGPLWPPLSRPRFVLRERAVTEDRPYRTSDFLRQQASALKTEM